MAELDDDVVPALRDKAKERLAHPQWAFPGRPHLPTWRSTTRALEAAMPRGYRDISGGKLDALAGWPRCQHCDRQLPKNCVFCVRCRFISIIRLPDSARGSAGGIFFLGRPGPAVAAVVAMSMLEQAKQQALLARTVGMRKVGVFPRAALIVGSFLLLSSTLNSTGHTTWSYVFGILGIVTMLGAMVVGSVATQRFRAELATRTARARSVYERGRPDFR